MYYLEWAQCGKSKDFPWVVDVCSQFSKCDISRNFLPILRMWVVGKCKCLQIALGDKIRIYAIVASARTFSANQITFQSRNAKTAFSISIKKFQLHISFVPNHTLLHISPNRLGKQKTIIFRQSTNILTSSFIHWLIFLQILVADTAESPAGNRTKQ